MGLQCGGSARRPSSDSSLISSLICPYSVNVIGLLGPSQAERAPCQKYDFHQTLFGTFDEVSWKFLIFLLSCWNQCRGAVHLPQTMWFCSDFVVCTFLGQVLSL